MCCVFFMKIFVCEKATVHGKLNLMMTTTALQLAKMCTIDQKYCGNRNILLLNEKNESRSWNRTLENQ